jgi:hypothetical protein
LRRITKAWQSPLFIVSALLLVPDFAVFERDVVTAMKRTPELPP